VTNFTGFAPLGTVLVALIGIGVAEHSGLIGAALRKLVLAAPRSLLTPIVVFAGVMSNMASEIGYVLLIPLAGLIFKSAGRHPIVGMAAAFAGVSGGYSANLLIGTIDPLLSGLSQEAARIVDPDYTVSPLANWYFMAFSTPVITVLGRGAIHGASFSGRSPVRRLGRFRSRRGADARGATRTALCRCCESNFDAPTHLVDAAARRSPRCGVLA
jgi:p-aminobenzoyl-glutamate transporter AbgT